MCGIFGASRPVAREVLLEMARRLAHRGPDGMAVSSQLGLVRLAIVGVEAPTQIFTQGSVASVMNGEIYNHRELGNSGDQSDGSLIPKLFVRDGASFVESLQGPFAIAIQEGERLHLIRDRLGKKPLYFTRLGRTVFFASEQKALTTLPGFVARLNERSVARYLRHGLLDDGELLFEGLDRVAPGEWVTVHRSGRLERRRWWQPAASTASLERTFSRAVKDRIPTEVPWALLLSGGLDSTLVGAAARDSLQRAVCMDAEGDVKLARLAAKKLGVKLEVVKLPEPSEEHFERALFHLEQPDAYSTWAMAPAVLHLGRALRDGGSRVALMGEGADELFLGYAWDAMQAALERGDEALPADAVRLLGPRAAYFGLRHSMAKLFSPHPRARQVWLDTASMTSGDEEEFVAPPGPTGARRRQRIGLELDMLTLPVLHADRLLMASGVEARMPFLDHRMVELALSLAPHRLEAPGNDKMMLRALAKKWLPQWKAPKKKGFSAAAAPSIEVLHGMRAQLARSPSLTTEQSFWKKTARWKDPLRAQVLWRHVVLEKCVRILTRAP
jgi:asparagine synthase (glutamine-hydrolysing)